MRPFSMRVPLPSALRIRPRMRILSESAAADEWKDSSSVSIRFRHGDEKPVTATLLIPVIYKGNNILDTHDGLWDDLPMNKTLQLPKTLQEAVSFFSDPQKTFDYAVSLRWPTGKVTCPRCDSTEHSFISTRRIWFCKECKKQFTVKVGTIFEDSALGMDKWMIAVWLIVNAKNGISSYEVARALGITQKSAWFMMHRVRLALHEKETVQVGGPDKEVEVDETFIGGAARFMHSNKRSKVILARGTKGKAAVFGVLERGGKVRAESLRGRKRHELETKVRAHI